MSIFKIFGAKSAAAHEQSGDGFASRLDWGRAKIAFERALDKLEKSKQLDAEAIDRLAQKIAGCRESLARQHRLDAMEMAEGGAVAEARELILLALELSTDAELRPDLESALRNLEHRLDVDTEQHVPEVSYEEPDESRVFEVSEEEYFEAIIATLPEEVQTAYASYGDDFRTGYLALNEGDFETACDYLTRAMKAHPEQKSYIPLELATAYLNLGRGEDARALLEGVIDTHPDALPAYRMLCEIYWENRAFDKAHQLLASVPGMLAESVAVYLLKGETYFQAGEVDSAEELYRHFLSSFGWNDDVAKALAKVHESRSEIDRARGLYSEMMKRCTGCGRRVDPVVKQKHADLCFAAGDRGSNLIESYLALAKEIPQLAAENYDKVSRIYSARGEDAQARRFRAIAVRAGLRR